MDDCAFCQLPKDGLPPHAIYENEQLFVMLDRQSLGFGHVMIIPKKHTEKIYDMEDVDYQNLLLFSKRLARMLQESLRPKAVAYVAHGAGLLHTHLHLVPITEQDGITDPKKYMRSLSDKELAGEAQRLISMLPKNFSDALSSES